MQNYFQCVWWVRIYVFLTLVHVCTYMHATFCDVCAFHSTRMMHGLYSFPFVFSTYELISLADLYKSASFPSLSLHPAVEGAHPQNYQNFMAVLCNYIVERQRDIQGDEIPFSTVYVRELWHM